MRIPNLGKVNFLDRRPHQGECLVRVAPMPLGPEHEVMPAVWIIVDPQVIAERFAHRHREIERLGKFGGGPMEGPLQIDLSDRGPRTKAVRHAWGCGPDLLRASRKLAYGVT
jgi:hypothetical protein